MLKVGTKVKIKKNIYYKFVDKEGVILREARGGKNKGKIVFNVLVENREILFIPEELEEKK